MASDEEEIRIREDVRGEDAATVRRITESSGFFYPEEVDTAVELVEERLAKGLASGYHFLFAERGGETIGYACYGPIACTKSSWDFYWLAVEDRFRGKGIGSRLIEGTERGIRERGGTRVYIETSSRPLYDPTRALYLKRGYREEARLEDYYGPGDSKVDYVKVL
jgi:GNAT superfamily N-acetyltransferase